MLVMYITSCNIDHKLYISIICSWELHIYDTSIVFTSTQKNHLILEYRLLVFNKAIQLDNNTASQ